jgi:ABC-type transport system involved in multi-copper enzyme maturation permease subunit
VSRLHGVRVVAEQAFRESARHRVLHALLAAMLLLSLGAHVLAWVSGDDPVRRTKVVADLSLSGLALLGSLAAIFLGTNLVHQEVERRTVYTVLARPLDRGSFLAGKLLGLIAVVSLACLIMGAVCLGSIALAGPAAWGKLLLAVLGTCLELTVVSALGLLFSVAAQPIEGAVFAVVLTAAGHMTTGLRELGAQLVRDAGPEPSLVLRATVRGLDVLYVLLPNLEVFNLRAQAVHDLALDGQRLLFVPAYAALWVAILLGLGVIAFRRRIL